MRRNEYILHKDNTITGKDIDDNPCAGCKLKIIDYQYHCFGPYYENSTHVGYICETLLEVSPNCKLTKGSKCGVLNY